jgi:exosortase A
MLNAASIPKHWQPPLLGIIVITLLCIAVFWETWHSIVSIWIRSDTYTHGFIVAPVSIWLIWIRRRIYLNLQAVPFLPALFLVGFCGFLWLTSDLVHVLGMKQFAVIGILTGSYWCILGNHITQKLLFPFCFLFLMAPFGEDFVPLLMEYTATFVVGMIRLTGMSVYREGLHFTLTSGSWSVVDACSGIRYLLSSITLGAVYMYLNYTSYLKRTVFMLASILVPILANGLRGYMIVMIGHLSDMKLATGVDHIIYGWVFFGLVMLLLFYVGSFWHDPPPETTTVEDALHLQNIQGKPHFWQALTLTMLCLSIWSPTSYWMSSRQGVYVEIPEALDKLSIPNWELTSIPDWGWEPNFQGVVAKSSYYLTNGKQTIGVYIGNFGDETAGELVNSQNVLIPKKDDKWSIVHNDVIGVDWSPGVSSAVEETALVSRNRTLLVFRWYRIGNENTASSYYAKLLQLFKRLSGNTSPELQMVLFTETEQGNYTQARKQLKVIAEACCGSE